MHGPQASRGAVSIAMNGVPIGDKKSPWARRFVMVEHIRGNRTITAGLVACVVGVVIVIIALLIGRQAGDLAVLGLILAFMGMVCVAIGTTFGDFL